MKKLLFLIGFVFLISYSVMAQKNSVNSEVIYAGLDKPTSIYVTQQYIFVVESGKHRILKLDHTGKVVETLGGLGTGDYQFDSPIDIHATNGLKIYVSDIRNNRIQIFDKRFQYLSVIQRYPNTQSGRPIQPTQLSINSFGELFFYNESSRSIISIDDRGSKLDDFQVPNVIRQVSDLQSVGRDLYILDLKSDQYHILAENGVQVKSFPLEDAVQLFVDKKGEEWLINSSSITNSREKNIEIQFSEDLEIKDVFILDGVFFLLTKNSLLKMES